MLEARPACSRAGAGADVAGTPSASSLAECDLTLSRRRMLTPMVIIAIVLHRCQCALEGPLQQARIIGPSKWCRPYHW